MFARKGWPFRGHSFIALSALIALLLSNGTFAQSDDKPLQIFRALDNKAETLKAKALELNRDLILIEEEAFIPSSAQLVVFFSLSKKTLPQLDSLQVKLELDEEIVANHLYTAREIEALFHGGKHRLYLGSLPVGNHRVSAVIVGQGNQDFEARSKIDFDKGWDRKSVDIELVLAEKKGAPSININGPSALLKR